MAECSIACAAAKSSKKKQEGALNYNGTVYKTCGGILEPKVENLHIFARQQKVLLMQ